MEKIHGNKHRFLKVFISIKETMQVYHNWVADWNNNFYDETGKFIRKGDKRVKYTHDRTFEAIIAILINRTAKRNKVNELKPYPNMYNINKPIEYRLNLIDIFNYARQHNNKRGVSLKTIRNHLKRLELSGVLLNIKYNHDFRTNIITVNPKILCLKDEINGNIIEKSQFLTGSLPISNKKKKKETPPFKNNNENKNKKRQSTNVDNMELLQATNISLKQDHLQNTRTTSADDKKIFDKQNKKFAAKVAKIYKIEDKKELRKIESDLHENLVLTKQKKEVASDVKDTLQKSNPVNINELQRIKKIAVWNFWIKYIIAFWSFTREEYLPETAGKNLHYVEQSFDYLFNDSMYFGACETIEHVEYQSFKLDKTINSTLNWKNKKLKENPKYNWQFNFPNRFIRGKMGPGNFTFKNAILTTERTMRNTGKIIEKYEKEMGKMQNKIEKNSIKELTGTAIQYIFENPQNVQQNVLTAQNYFETNYSEKYVTAFKTNFQNQYFIQQLTNGKAKFKPNKEFIENCFSNKLQITIEMEINVALKELEANIKNDKVGITPKMRKYFSVTPDFKLRPYLYNTDTLKFINYYIKH